MGSRLIDLEGLHGCGKSASAWHLRRYLSNAGVTAQLFQEADMDSPVENPLDFRWVAVMSEPEAEALAKLYPGLRSYIEQYPTMGDGFQYGALYYPAIAADSGTPVDMLRKHEPYDGSRSPEDYMMLLRCRFRSFVETAMADDTIYIFDGALRQHPLNELLRFGRLSDEQLVDFICELGRTLCPSNRYWSTCQLMTCLGHWIASRRSGCRTTVTFILTGSTG